MSKPALNNSNARIIGVVVPVFNEADGISHFHDSIIQVLSNLSSYSFKIYYINDGSRDGSAAIISKLKPAGRVNIELVDFSRNFGKEAAVTAGIHAANEDSCCAVIILDSDGQHPVARIGDFIAKWEAGAEVVVGVRANSKHESFMKKLGSRVFYGTFNRILSAQMIPSSTDFRLINAQVAEEFSKLSERSRMTRGLIDWLGFKRSYVTFDALDREHGTASYGTRKLFQLALNSFVSLSMLPLYASGYLGIIFMCVSLVVGGFIFIQQFILGDPMNLKFSGPTILGVTLVFLVGVILSSIGLLALYIAKILEEAQNRPLYIIRKSKK